MLTLCLDTSYLYLGVALIRDDRLIASYCEVCAKKQSESIFTAIDNVFSQAGVDRNDIDSVCLSEGPGSYTGVRIGMTVGKVLCSINNIDLYTISSLRLYASGQEDTMVIMDARASRAYFGLYDKDKCLIPDQVLPLEQIPVRDHRIVLDGTLVGKDNVPVDVPNAFLMTKSSWKKVDNIHHLVPVYLKESDAYYR